MLPKSLAKVLAMCLLIIFVSGPVALAASAEEKRESVRKMANDTLERLYKVHPSARAAIESAAGYAVFSNTGFKLFLFGAGTGKGIAVNYASGEEIFMKVTEIDVGLGLGVKKISAIFVFETDKAFERFISKGYEFGGQTTAAATDGVSGDSIQGAIVIAPDMYLYQLTDKGLALELTLKGTKYYKDSELN